MRVVKEHDERKTEIIKTASNLFLEKGYENCSVNDIINAVGIAKGTFYYYFKSKEDVLDAAVKQISDITFAKVEEIAKDKTVSPIDRMLKVMFAIKLSDDKDEALIKEMHSIDNATLHQKMLISILNNLTPIFTQIIKEGNDEGVFSCPYPEQSILIFLSSALTLLNDGIFYFEDDKKMEILQALLFLMEKMLCVEDDTFSSKMIEFYKESGNI